MLKFILATLLSVSLVANANVVVEMYGDSTTNSECNVLKTKYDTNVTFVCKGVGGTTYKDLIKGENGQSKLETTLPNSNANLILVNFGINDSCQGYANPMWYVGEVRRLALTNNKTLVIQTSNPINHPCYQVNSNLANDIRTWTQSTNTHLVDNYLNVFYTPNWTTLLVDGVHPNTQLYKIKANYTYSIINPLIQWLLDNQ